MKHLHIFLDAIAALLIIFLGTFVLTFQNTGKSKEVNEVSRKKIEKNKLKVIRVSIKDDKITAHGKEVKPGELKSLFAKLKPDLVKISTTKTVINKTLLAAESSGASVVFKISY